MNTGLRFAISGFIALLAHSTSAAAGDLGQQITQRDGWAGYHVSMLTDAGSPCCYEWHGRHGDRQECRLDSNSWSFSKTDEPGRFASETLNVYLHVTHGTVDRVRAFDGACSVADAAQVRWLEGTNSGDSIAFLARLADAAGKDMADSAAATIALHADPAATPALVLLADASHSRHVREQALFWLAQARGADGARVVERVATSDSDAELRQQAVFDLSEAHGIDGYAVIHGIAQHDSSEEVRSQALFWMAQMNDPRAKNDILAAISSETSDEVCERAVFALSQLKDELGTPALIGLVRGNYPRKVKEQALFWLGESGSDEAMRFLDEVLDKRAAKPTRS